MSIEAKSLSSPLGNREHLKTENRSKPWVGLRYPYPGAAWSGQGGVVSWLGAWNRRALLPHCISRPLVK